VAKSPFFGKTPVIIFDGTNTAIAPEIRDPTRTNGNPSNANARNENKKFCQVKVNQLIKGITDPTDSYSDRARTSASSVEPLRPSRGLTGGPF
jgi:hypothetical protein